MCFFTTVRWKEGRKGRWKERRKGRKEGRKEGRRKEGKNFPKAYPTEV